jgi:hypothetical protein
MAVEVDLGIAVHLASQKMHCLNPLTVDAFAKNTAIVIFVTEIGF